MTKHQTCYNCRSSFVGPDSNIGSNWCADCGPSNTAWAEAWDAVRANVLGDPDQPPEIINWALDFLDTWDPRRG